MGKSTLITLGLVISAIVIFAIMFFSYENKYNLKNNDYEAAVSKSETAHDKMWKIIKQQAGVTENYSKSFKENFSSIMKSRNYGGELMKWIQEANPNFSTAMYEKLMVSIEVYRTEFNMVQENVISRHLELKNLLTTYPSKIFLVWISGYTVPELKIVTSSRTDAAFESGKDDDTDLFDSDTSKHK